MIQISEKQADVLMKERVATMFDCHCECEGKRNGIIVDCGNCDGNGTAAQGFFSAGENARKDIVLLINNDGYFIRASEDLVKSEDEVFVAFCDELKDGGKLPNFLDIFTVEEL